MQAQQNLRPEDFSEKIKKLKQKFEEIQPGSNTNVSQKQIQEVISGGRTLAINQQQSGVHQQEYSSQQPQDNNPSAKDERAAEIKRKIDEMKNRLNQNFDKSR